jgi:hypothetical protein
VDETDDRCFRRDRRKERNYRLARGFGYGVPDYDRAIASANNHLALFAQATIQPFKLDGQRKINECHYHTLPIPTDMPTGLSARVVAGIQQIESTAPLSQRGVVIELWCTFPVDLDNCAGSQSARFSHTRYWSMQIAAAPPQVAVLRDALDLEANGSSEKPDEIDSEKARPPLPRRAGAPRSVAISRPQGHYMGCPDGLGMEQEQLSDGLFFRDELP